MKVSELPNDEIVKLFVQLRDRRAQRKKAFEVEDTSDKEKQEKLGAVLLQRYNELGIESARTQFGTAFKTLEFRGNIADRDTVKAQVMEQGLWELVTLMPNKAGIKAYIDEHGEVPPGFNWHQEYTIRVNRA